MGFSCNYRCSFCYQPCHAGNEMPEMIWESRLLNLYDTVEEIVLQGGEPTILSNCIELRDMLLNYARIPKFSLVTNGSRLDDSWQQVMAQRFTFKYFNQRGLERSL